MFCPPFQLEVVLHPTYRIPVLTLLKETYSQIQERNRRVIRNRTNKRLAELAQKAESERHGSSSTQLADEIEDKLGLCGSSLWRVCQCGVLGVFLVILSMFVWSVVFHLGLKKP